MRKFTTFSIIVVCPFPYEQTIADRHSKAPNPTTSNATPQQREGAAALLCGTKRQLELYHDCEAPVDSHRLRTNWPVNLKLFEILYPPLGEDVSVWSRHDQDNHTEGIIRIYFSQGSSPYIAHRYLETCAPSAQGQLCLPLHEGCDISNEACSFLFS